MGLDRRLKHYGSRYLLLRKLCTAIILVQLVRKRIFEEHVLHQGTVRIIRLIQDDFDVLFSIRTCLWLRFLCGA